MNHIISSGGNKVLCPMKREAAYYNSRTKIFGDTAITTCFSRPIFNPLKHEKHVEHEKEHRISTAYYDPATDSMISLSAGTVEAAPRTEREIREDSIRRAKNRVKEICFANEFELFVTMTLDAQKHSRTDAKQILKTVNNWCSNQVQRRGMKYLIIPEYHKRVETDGKQAVHFHGLISGDFSLADSGLKTPRGQAIYNLGQWDFGFTEAIKIEEKDYNKTANYVSKYITKDARRVFGRWYLSGGKGLKREVPTTYFNADYDAFDGKEYAVPQSGLYVKYRKDDV